MYPTQYKINLFLATADFIEQNPEQYNWGSPRTCNCGILATIINPGLELLSSDDFFNIGSYSLAFKDPSYVCSTTGVYLNTVMQTLVDAGFSPQEIQQIEFTNLQVNSYVRDSYMYADREYVIQYFRTTAKEMQQVLLSQQNKLRVPVTVSV